jgi:hypothetical protein
MEYSESPVLMLVTKVYPHKKESDKFSTEVDVRTRSGDKKLPKVPVLPNHDGHVAVPQVGDQVKVEFLRGRGNEPFVTNASYNEESRPPLSRAGHWRHEFQRKRGKPLYIEAEQRDHTFGEPDTVRFAVKEGGLGNPIARIELDRSGRNPVIRLTRGKEEESSTDMGLVLNFGTGEFKIGDGSQFGIESDGSGNFTWYAKSVDFKTDGTEMKFDTSGGGSGGG